MFSFLGNKDKKKKLHTTKVEESLEKLSPESQEILKGYIHNSRYSFSKYLGEGGFGTVVSSFDGYLNRATALKKLHARFRDDTHQLRAIMNEVRLISYLAHPGVVSVYDAFVDPEGNFSYTMELLDGENLEDLLFRLEDEGTRLPLSQGIKIFTKLIETLAFVHDKGVLHLDIKPSNIMLGKYGEVQILDWGTAHLYASERYEEYLRSYGKDAKAEDIIHDRSSRIEGTIPFMSPEQTERPRNQLTPASDIFSAGVVLYQALSGRFPFSYENLERFLYDLHQVEPTPLHELRGDVPVRLSQICARMLSKDIDSRYSSFHEILKDLEDFSNSGQMFRQVVYQPGEVLIQQGEMGDHAFQIIDGMVEITVDVEGNKKILATRSSGAIIGELAVFTKEPRSATVVAREPTTIKILNQAMIMEELEKLNPWVGHMVYQLSQRFIEQNKRIIAMELERSKDSSNESKQDDENSLLDAASVDSEAMERELGSLASLPTIQKEETSTQPPAEEKVEASTEPSPTATEAASTSDYGDTPESEPEPEAEPEKASRFRSYIPKQTAVSESSPLHKVKKSGTAVWNPQRDEGEEKE